MKIVISRPRRFPPPLGVRTTGDVVDVDEALARQLISQNLASENPAAPEPQDDADRQEEEA